MLEVVAPQPTPDDQYFWDGLRDGRLLLRRCARCSRMQHPPLPMCPQCHSLEWTVVDSDGLGTVYSWVQVKHPTLDQSSDRIVAVIELGEGPRVVANLVADDLAAVTAGAPVEVFYETFANDVVLPQFRLST